MQTKLNPAVIAATGGQLLEVLDGLPEHVERVFLVCLVFCQVSEPQAGFGELEPQSRVIAMLVEEVLVILNHLAEHVAADFLEPGDGENALFVETRVELIDGPAGALEVDLRVLEIARHAAIARRRRETRP